MQSQYMLAALLVFVPDWKPVFPRRAGWQLQIIPEPLSGSQTIWIF
jgi:hypothetical protein